MILISWEKTNSMNKKTEGLSDASKEAGTEVKTERTQ
jgi:hypothetical protein